MAEPDKNFKHILRVVNTDLDGNKPIYAALRKIKGVSFMYANLACKLAKVDKYKITGNLTEAEAEKLDDVIRNPSKYETPLWMLNRRKDYESGEDMHVLSGDLDYAKPNDVKRLRMIKSYRGLRHATGKPVRGQRTKSNFRRNKGRVTGVKKKKK